MFRVRPDVITGLTVDSYHKKLYYTLATEGKVVEITTSGKERRVLSEVTGSYPCAIAIDEKNR